jgi:hypothetical protein
MPSNALLLDLLGLFLLILAWRGVGCGALCGVPDA